jgi:RNA polymerase sigma-70 factor, ECF subfamily
MIRRAATRECPYLGPFAQRIRPQRFWNLVGLSREYVMKAGPRLDQSLLQADLTEGELVQRAAAGDEEAFLILYRRNEGAIFRYALHMSGQREIAEEVTQDVFVAVLGGLRHYAGERGPLQAYLLGMARNHVRRYLAQTAVPAEAPEACVPPGLEEQQQIAQVRAAILRLPLHYREVVVLCDLEGFDYAQVAAHLGCAVGTVRSRLHRARRILQARLVGRQRCSV